MEELKTLKKSLENIDLSPLEQTLKATLATPSIATPTKPRGKAVILEQAGAEFILQDLTGVSFRAFAAEDLFLVPKPGDTVLYECLEEECYILHILKTSKQAEQKRTLRLPENATLLSANELELVSRNIVTRAIERSDYNKSYELASEDVRVSAKSSRLNAQIAQEHVNTKMLVAEVYKSNVSKIADKHYANSRVNVDNSYSLNADRVKLNAKGHVDIDGEKINMG